MILYTSSYQDASSHQIWCIILDTKFGKRSYLQKGSWILEIYAPDMIIQKTRSEVKATVTQNGSWHSAIKSKMHLHTWKFGIPISRIPTSKNIRVMLHTQ